jgi:hypothetical protein
MIDRRYLDSDNRLSSFFVMFAVAEAGSSEFPYVGSKEEILCQYLPYKLPIQVSHWRIPSQWYRDNIEGAWYETVLDFGDRRHTVRKVYVMFEFESDAIIYRLLNT